MSFATRTALATRLETAFIAAFNRQIETHRIVKTGIEATEVNQHHDAIRYCHDTTTHYVRYFPDSVMLSLDPQQADTALVEFKCAETGVRLDSFLQRLQRECTDMDPPFGSRHDIYNIEADALDHYQQLAQAGVRIIIVAYCTWHPDTQLRAQFVDNIAVCNRFDPSRGQQNIGSGTHIANANFASFASVHDFFAQHYGLGRPALEQIEQIVAREFTP